MVRREGAPSPDWRVEAALRSFHFNLTTAEEGSRGLEPLHGFPKAQSQAVILIAASLTMSTLGRK